MNGNYYKSDYLDNNHLINDNGIIEKVGNDYLIVSNPTNGEWYFILPVYLGFITFEEAINY